MPKRVMRAARFYGPGDGIRVEEVPYPDPGPGDVVVKVAACGICGSDLHFLEGMPVPAGVPVTLGHEPAGVIEEVGSQVSTWKPGDRVAMHLGNGCGHCRICLAGHPNCCPELVVPGLHIDGAYAEYVRVPAETLTRVPDAVNLSVAAVATDCVATPYHALTCRGRLRAGERVAVIGTGGLGSQAVRLASVLGAAQVVAVDLSSAALERAAGLGATHTVNVRPGEDPSERVREATEGGADLVLECVGSAETTAAAANCLLPGGRLVAVGVGMMPPRIDIPQALFCLYEFSLIGTFGSHKEDLEEIFRLEASGTIDIEASISHRVPLERVAEGLEMLRTKQGDPQRIIVEF